MAVEFNWINNSSPAAGTLWLLVYNGLALFKDEDKRLNGVAWYDPENYSCERNGLIDVKLDIDVILFTLFVVDHLFVVTLTWVNSFLSVLVDYLSVFTHSV